MAPLSLGKKSQKPGDAHGRPVEKSTAHPPGPSRKTKRTPTHPLGVCHKKAGWALLLVPIIGDGLGVTIVG